MNSHHQRKGRLRQLIRCHKILDRLASRRIDYNANLLAEELGFTTKTIYRDLRALKEAGVFIEYDPHRKRYRLGRHPLTQAYLETRTDTVLARGVDLAELSLNLSEASRYLGLSRRQLRALVGTGQIPTTQRGRQLRMAIKDVVRLKRLVADNSRHPGWRLVG